MGREEESQLLQAEVVEAMRDFKAGELVEELDNPGGDKWPRSRALVVRVCSGEEFPAFPNRQLVEVRWLATGAKSIQFNGDLRRVKQ